MKKWGVFWTEIMFDIRFYVSKKNHSVCPLMGITVKTALENMTGNKQTNKKRPEEKFI